MDFTQNTQDLWNINETPFDGKKQYAHPHPTTSNDGSLVTFGTNFFAYSAAPPDQPIDPSVEPQVSNEPRCCGLKVYRFDED